MTLARVTTPVRALAGPAEPLKRIFRGVPGDVFQLMYISESGSDLLRSEVVLLGKVVYSCQDPLTSSRSCTVSSPSVLSMQASFST